MYQCLVWLTSLAKGEGFKKWKNRTAHYPTNWLWKKKSTAAPLLCSRYLLLVRSVLLSSPPCSSSSPSLGGPGLAWPRGGSGAGASGWRARKSWTTALCMDEKEFDSRSGVNPKSSDIVLPVPISGWKKV
jgi:hypothetical protein